MPRSTKKRGSATTVAGFIDYAESSGAEGLTRVATLARRMETR